MLDLESGPSGAGLVAPPTETTGGSPLRSLLLLVLFALMASRRARGARGIRAGPAWAAVPL